MSVSPPRPADVVVPEETMARPASLPAAYCRARPRRISKDFILGARLPGVTRRFPQAATAAASPATNIQRAASKSPGTRWKEAAGLLGCRQEPRHRYLVSVSPKGRRSRMAPTRDPPAWHLSPMIQRIANKNARFSTELAAKLRHRSSQPTTPKAPKTSKPPSTPKAPIKRVTWLADDHTGTRDALDDFMQGELDAAEPADANDVLSTAHRDAIRDCASDTARGNRLCCDATIDLHHAAPPSLGSLPTRTLLPSWKPHTLRSAVYHREHVLGLLLSPIDRQT